MFSFIYLLKFIATVGRHRRSSTDSFAMFAVI